MSDIRLIRLEEKLAYQEHTIGELNDVVVRQQRQLDVLERSHAQLQEQLRKLAALVPDGGGHQEEIPPHY
ncbi:MAG: SlyX family protein [Ectothiorhodospiraceae bacterium]|nr:SlyX family protein [Ectothiorhodospiraceae bacterium]MCH8502716.1 SlyX family protein [Ectothiorhodospiraceae bacterium]